MSRNLDRIIIPNAKIDILYLILSLADDLALLAVPKIDEYCYPLFRHSEV